jgi:hypothetical protein
LPFLLPSPFFFRPPFSSSSLLCLRAFVFACVPVTALADWRQFLRTGHKFEQAGVLFAALLLAHEQIEMRGRRWNDNDGGQGCECQASDREEKRTATRHTKEKEKQEGRLVHAFAVAAAASPAPSKKNCAM